jgi:tripartite-type tricarboxylate transporter receptor subunit TctC
MMMRTILSALLAAIFAITAHAQTTDSVSFAGRQIKLLIGYSPTGYGYDTYGRLLARHLAKYLPGNPTIIPQNRPGAGSLNLANYLYNAAPKDGTEIGIVGRGVAMEPLIGGSASQGRFDSTKFTWLGSMNNEVSGLFIRQGAPAANLQDILKGAPLQMGSTGAGGDQHAFHRAEFIARHEAQADRRLCRHAGDHAGDRAWRARRHRRLLLGRGTRRQQG